MHYLFIINFNYYNLTLMIGMLHRIFYNSKFYFMCVSHYRSLNNYLINDLWSYIEYKYLSFKCFNDSIYFIFNLKFPTKRLIKILFILIE